MHILYLGELDDWTTSGQRANALSRLGHEVTKIDPYVLVRDFQWRGVRGRVHFHTGYRLLQGRVYRWLERELAKVGNIDLVWVNSGELFGQKCVGLLKARGVPCVLYNNDDPTGGRDRGRFGSLLNAIPHYDICVVMREVNVAEYKERGAKSVIRTWMSYDEVEHSRILSSEDPLLRQFASEVVFVGTWMRGDSRESFLTELVQRGVPLSIWGDRWMLSRYWSVLEPHYRGGALRGRSYVAAIQGAKVALGLLSKGNRDLHTSRSAEIPYIGTVFCGEATSEHRTIFGDCEFGLLWSSAAECAEQCLGLLENPSRRDAIAARGQKRIVEVGFGNEIKLAAILAKIANKYEIKAC